MARLVSKDTVKLVIEQDKLDEMRASLQVLIASRLAAKDFNERFRAEDEALEKFLVAWERLPQALRQDIGSRLADLAVSCGPSEQQVIKAFVNLNMRSELRVLGPLPTQGRGEASEYPGQKEAVLWLLNEWRSNGQDETIGNLKKKSGRIYPSETVIFLAYHLQLLFPNAVKIKEDAELELWYLKRSREIIKHLRTTNQIAKGTPRSKQLTKG